MNEVGSVLVDTNVVVAYFRGDTGLRPQFDGPTTLCLPWVVLGELHFGAQRAQRRQEQFTYIQDLLKYAVVLFADQETTEVYGVVKAELAELGKPIPDNDLWIAAMARQFDLPLATRDSHFSHVPGLKTLFW
ncbi:MAG: type II toxin-antitoxin system VapC family toxin [Candidatus Solibacter usitatus]|nr:type II toxin-antitoxin system VapC family toxin [Candidatus Solibacter usitatus]